MDTERYELTETLASKGSPTAYEWDVSYQGHRLGKLLRDSEGTWYGQTPKADFQRFEDPEMHEDDRRAAAIAWLVEQKS